MRCGNVGIPLFGISTFPHAGVDRSSATRSRRWPGGGQPGRPSIRDQQRSSVTASQHDAISVQLITPNEELKSYLRSNIRDFSILDTGLMPSSQGKLTDQQIADVVAYLSSLKGN